jgi:phosphatidate phosphatase PAH1
MRIHLLLATISLIGGCSQLPAPAVPAAPTTHALAVVFDIDGTLTPNVMAFTEARPDAATAVHTFADRGYRVIYLSTRVSVLQHGISHWLQENGFPPSSVHVALTDADHDDPAAFKARILKEYRAQGWTLAGAYGDSSSDFEAYANAGIPKAHVFALLRKGDTSCQPGVWQQCLAGWGEHLPYIKSKVD